MCGGGHRRLRCIPRCASVRGCGMSRGGRGGIVVCLGGGGGGHCAMSWAVLGSLVCPPGRWAAVCPLVMLGWWPWCVPWDGGTGSVACPQGAEGIAVACALGCGEGCGLSGAGGAQGIAGGLLGLCRSVGCWGCGSMRGAGVLLWARCECPRGAAGWGWPGRQFLKDVVVDVLLL